MNRIPSRPFVLRVVVDRGAFLGAGRQQTQDKLSCGHLAPHARYDRYRLEARQMRRCYLCGAQKAVQEQMR
jgi:hypothetical protein